MIIGIAFTKSTRFKVGATLDFTHDLYGINRVVYNTHLPNNVAIDTNFFNQFTPSSSYDF